MNPEVTVPQDQISVLTEQVAVLTAKQKRSPGNVVC